MILVTGANGQVGRAIIKALLSRNEQVRAFVFKIEHIQEIRVLGNMDVVVGDMLNQEDLDKAFIGIQRVYHICSAINPDEVLIGEKVINAARKADVEHFVFHSVPRFHLFGFNSRFLVRLAALARVSKCSLFSISTCAPFVSLCGQTVACPTLAVTILRGDLRCAMLSLVIAAVSESATTVAPTASVLGSNTAN